MSRVGKVVFRLVGLSLLLFPLCCLLFFSLGVALLSSPLLLLGGILFVATKHPINDICTNPKKPLQFCAADAFGSALPLYPKRMARTQFKCYPHIRPLKVVNATVERTAKGLHFALNSCCSSMLLLVQYLLYVYVCMGYTYPQLFFIFYYIFSFCVLHI